MLCCPRNKIYIDKTKRQLCIRIGEHIASINKDDDCPLVLHFTQFHLGNQKGLTVKGIYVLNQPLRRGDFDTILLQKEKMWIYNLGSLIQQGLNNECNLQPFLEA